MRSGKISRQRCRHDEPQTHQDRLSRISIPASAQRKSALAANGCFRRLAEAHAGDRVLPVLTLFGHGAGYREAAEFGEAEFNGYDRGYSTTASARASSHRGTI
jgi:hypothetical protein